MRSCRAALVLVLLAASARAQVKRLHPDLARDPEQGGLLTDFLLSPDGSTVLLLAEVDGDGIELYAQPSDGSAAAYRLHPALPPGADVRSPMAGATRVAFQADALVDGRFELWSAPLDGSATPVRLSPPLPAGGNLSGYLQLTPDCERVLWLGDHDTLGAFGLWSAPLDASAPAVRLHAPLGPNNDVFFRFRITPDGTRVVFLADLDTNLVEELYCAPVDGSAPPVKLSHRPVERDVKDFVLGPLGQQVLFRTDLGELFGAPLDGSTVEVALALEVVVPNHDERNGASYALASAETRALFLSEDGSFLRPRLFTTPLVAPLPTLLSPTGSAPEVRAFALAADDQRVAFVFSPSAANEQLLVTAVDGSSAPVRVDFASASARLDTDVVWLDPQRLLFRGHATSALRELHVTPTDGSAVPLRLNPPLATGGSVASFLPVGPNVVYLASQDDEDQIELFSVPADGSATAEQVNAPLANGHVERYLASAASGRVVYEASEVAPGRVDFNSRLVDASLPSVQLGPPLEPGPIVGDVEAIALTPDGRHALYVATQENHLSAELYSVDLARGLARTKLSHPMATPGNVRVLLPAPDSQRVVYTGRANLDGDEGLYVGPVDGSEPALRLDLSGNGLFHPVLLSGDGERALYRAPRNDGAMLLYSVPLDGSTSAVGLSGSTAVADDFVSAGARVVYRRGGAPVGRELLYSAPLDGGAPALVLFDASASLGGVQRFRVSADEAMVAFVADGVVDGRFELYSVPVDGSAPASVLSGAIVGQGDVTELALAPVSPFVVYRADALRDEVHELFVAPLDGSAPPTALVPPLPDLADAGTPVVTESERVLYLADALTDGLSELFSVPLAGGTPTRLSSEGNVTSVWPVEGARVVYRVGDDLWLVAEAGGAALRLSQPLTAGQHMHEVQIVGGRAFFVAANELRTVALTAPFVRGSLTPAMVPGGHIEDFAAVPGGPLVYFADQAVDERFEAWLAWPTARSGAAAAGAPTGSATRTVDPGP